MVSVITICFNQYTAGGNLTGCPPGDDDCINLVIISSTCWQINDFEDEEEWGGTWGPIITTGGGGSGSGWESNPCRPIDPINNPCEQEPGWIPVPQEIDDPCDSYIISLQNDTTFAARFNSLDTTSITNLNFEKGLFVKDRNDNSYLELNGNNSEPFIQFNFLIQMDGFLHSHYAGLNSIFSPDDLIFMAQVYLNGLARDSTNLFWGVTSNYSNAYLIKVTNPTNFRTFAEKIASDKKKAERFYRLYKDAFSTNDAFKNEKEFLKMLKEMKVETGLTLFRANENCTRWTKLKLNAFGDIIETNCI